MPFDFKATIDKQLDIACLLESGVRLWSFLSVYSLLKVFAMMGDKCSKDAGVEGGQAIDNKLSTIENLIGVIQ